MRYSFTYYITLFVLKLKGIKSNFSKDPVDYKKIRKGDLHSPKGRFFKEHVLSKFNVLQSVVTEVGTNTSSDQLLLYIHGGAFVSGPGQHHWDSIKYIARETGFKIWMCDYPKAPENKITIISNNIDSIYIKAVEEFNPSNICIIGDSAGGTLITSLVQRLIELKKELPKKIVLVSPVMDASLSNPEIEQLEKKDPVLSKTGVLSAKKMCAGDIDLKASLISPIYGSFEDFPPTLMFIAQNDIMYPDEKLAVKKMMEADVNIEVVEGISMPHIWPLLPVMKEARLALKEMIRWIKS